MAAAEQCDYKVFKATAASQLPEHGFIEVTYCLGAEANPNPDPGDIHLKVLETWPVNCGQRSPKVFQCQRYLRPKPLEIPTMKTEPFDF